MKCCVSTDVGTWTNWLTFYPDPDYSPDAPTYTYWWTAAAAKRGFKMALFTVPSNTFVGGKCALLSAVLANVYSVIVGFSVFDIVLH